MDYVDDEDIKKEAKFLMKLNHPNVVQVKGICLSESCIMMEFMILGLKPYGSNIQVHLIFWCSFPVWINHSTTWAGYSWCSNISSWNGLSHRDLKPSNIFVSNTKDDFGVLQVKLSDFGESRGNIVQMTQCMETHTVNIYKS